MWPMAVAIDWGGGFRTNLEVSPGKPVTCFKSRAVHSVDKEGENRAVWTKVTSSAGDTERCATLAKAAVVIGNF
jgi:hypothetical protein